MQHSVHQQSRVGGTFWRYEDNGDHYVIFNRGFKKVEGDEAVRFWRLFMIDRSSCALACVAVVPADASVGANAILFAGLDLWNDASSLVTSDNARKESKKFSDSGVRLFGAATIGG